MNDDEINAFGKYSRKRFNLWFDRFHGRFKDEYSERKACFEYGRRVSIRWPGLWNRFIRIFGNKK